MKKPGAYVDILLISLLVARAGWLHGRQWEFGPRGLPVCVLSPDGTTYRDGSEIDPISRSIIDSGLQEVWYATFLGICAVLELDIARRKYIRVVQKRREKSDLFLALAQRYEREGRREAAEWAYASYRESLEANRRLLRKMWSMAMKRKATMN
jgi:hypothetical protein